MVPTFLPIRGNSQYQGDEDVKIRWFPVPDPIAPQQRGGGARRRTHGTCSKKRGGDLIRPGPRADPRAFLNGESREARGSFFGQQHFGYWRQPTCLPMWGVVKKSPGSELKLSEALNLTLPLDNQGRPSI